MNNVIFFPDYDPAHWQTEQRADGSSCLYPRRAGWHGYGEYHRLENGIIIGRGEIYAATCAEEPAVDYTCYFGLHIILEASYTISSPALSQPLHIHSGQIWQRTGFMAKVGTQWQSGNHRVLTVDFPPEVMNRWAEYGGLPRWLLSPSPEKKPQIHLLCLHQHRRLLAHAYRLIRQPLTTLHDRLCFESLSLSLLAALFDTTEQPKPAKIDDVIALIRAEYHTPLTISALSRRCGINECYLKQQFKARTGKTVAQYIRDLRMQEALRLLLDEGKSVQQTAYYIGYHDPAYFSKLFARTHGISPARLLRHG